MNCLLLTVEQVETLHDLVLNPGELTRVDNRILYGMIEDVFDLAAAYAEAIAQGHCFNDANKCTAYRAVIVCLKLNGVLLTHVTEDTGQQIIRLAQGQTDAGAMADWLRARAG
jgi:death-on-curing protein